MEKIPHKPDWGDAPEFAGWLAMDRSGMWRWFVCKPFKSVENWLVNNGHIWTAKIDGWEGTITYIRDFEPDPGVPLWANWIAMDQCGAWWWYDSEPLLVDDGWFPSGEGLSQACYVWGWDTTLERRDTS